MSEEFFKKITTAGLVQNISLRYFNIVGALN